MKPLLSPLFALSLTVTGWTQENVFPPAPPLTELPDSARNIQRTMRLLATSTPEQRHTVRVLFYGQSITEQAWSKAVAEDLRKRFPDANLVVENRAIGGHSSQLLVKAAEADLYPFQPDLLIFHVYGAHNAYEDIIRRVRERTCAEILQQNDHITKAGDLEEETEAAKLAPGKGSWDAFMNHNFLPSLSRKYGTAFCDQRAVWKTYLRENQLEPKSLLKDSVHLNKQGEFLMGEIVKAHLRYEPKLGDSPAEGWVKTYTVGKDVQWSGKLTLPFTGTRLELIAADGTASPGSIRIDGKKPSEHAGTYTFTRTSYYPGSNWPCILRVGSQAQLQEEEWTLTMREVSPDLKSFRFELVGSETGADGTGERGQRFVSNSGRVVIDPEDWNLDYALKVFKKPVGGGFQVKWKVLRHALDELVATRRSEPGGERTVVIAEGLPNTAHTLEISGNAEPPIKAIRVYTPPIPGK